MDPRGTVGRIYKEEYYTLLHTKYESSGLYGFISEKKIFHVFSIISLCQIMMFPRRGGACIDPRGKVVRIYRKDHYYIVTHKI